MFGNMQFTGDVDTSRSIKQTNRSGASTAAGDVLVRDLLQSDAASTTVRTALSNLVTPATANLGMPPAVAKGVVADDEEAQFVAFGKAEAKVSGAVSAGDYLTMVDAQKHFATGTDSVAGTTVGSLCWAIALEDNASGTNVIDVFILAAPVRL